MTAERVHEAVALYRKRLQDIDIPQARYPDDQPPLTVSDILEHCHWMLDQIGPFLEQGRMGREKAARWLGFVQGCFWATRYYTIAQMKDHNRPDSERPPQ